MKTFIVLIAAALIAGSASLALAALGIGIGENGSPHNFTDTFFEVGFNGSGGWNESEENCRVCHVPHDHGRARYTNGLLWNHEVSSATYTMYDNSWSSTLTHTQDAEPTGSSKLCLACHDGTVGIDTFDKYAGNPYPVMAYGDNLQIPQFTDGGNPDMRGTHPISIVYDSGDGDVGAAGGLNPVATAWELSGTIADTLEDGKVQCATCHDVHDSQGVSVPGTRLLRASQRGSGKESALCLTCHNK